MVASEKTTEPAHEMLVEKCRTADDLRAQRVWMLVNVAWMTWLFFTVYCWVRGYAGAAALCSLEVIVIRIAILAHRRSDNFRRLMNMVLGLTASGLVFVALSHPGMQATMLFYPVSILIASQLLGTRAAFNWVIVNIVAFTVFRLCGPSKEGILAVTHLDEMIQLFGVSGCVFFCCQQGEQFYRERTKSIMDASEQLKKKADHLRTLATTDALTGLTNRFQFQNELRNAVGHAAESGKKMALLMIDMDGFKEINDTLGHPVGDLALVEIGNRLTQRFADRAIVARLGGDEFCLVIRDIKTNACAGMIAKEVGELLTERYLVGDCEFPLGASVGYAICPEHTVSDTDLLAYSDTAMFFAKDNQLGHACYSLDMTERLVEYRAMQERLSVALDRGEFFLVYQPQVDLRSGNVIGVEALLRWNRDGEIVSPFRFIPLLEKSREIVNVGRWIIRESCRQLRKWQDAGYDVEVSVNLSAVQFSDENFDQHVAEPIKEFGLDAGKLDFEITESLLVDDVQQAVERLSKIKSLGASISIDDFGTGYSSLAYLRQFPLDRLKIDRAFVMDYPDSDDGVIAGTIVALAKAIGLKVLAEGVETEQQLEFLKSLDCDEYQGYLFSRPVTADEVTKLFTRPSPAVSSSS